MRNRSAQNEDCITSFELVFISKCGTAASLLSEYLKDSVHIIQILNKFTSST